MSEAHPGVLDKTKNISVDKEKDSTVPARRSSTLNLSRRLTEPSIEVFQNFPARIRETARNLMNKQNSGPETTKSDNQMHMEKVMDSDASNGTSTRKQKYSAADTVGKDYLLELKPKKTLSSKNIKDVDAIDQLNFINEARPVTLTKATPTPDLTIYEGDFKYSINMERKRQQLITEMMNTEKTYVEFLRTVIMLFITPLRKSIATDSPLLSKDQLQTVFQNIEEIHDLHGELLKGMAKRKQKSTIHWADMLISCWSKNNFMNAYQVYINGYTAARLFVSEAMKLYSQNAAVKQDPIIRFAEFVHRQLSNDLCLGFGSVTSFLITPIQRLPRYLLYLKDLHSCTPEGHPDRVDVEKAYELLLQVTAHIDEQKLKYDEIYKVQALHQKFVVRDRIFIQEILNPSRKLLGEGLLLEKVDDEKKTEKSKKSDKDKVLRYILLFSDLLVCASKDEDDNLHLEWKVDLYTSQIRHVSPLAQKKSTDFYMNVGAKADGPDKEEHFLVTERTLTGGFPLSILNYYQLYPFTEGEFSSKFWLNLFHDFVKGPEDPFFITYTGTIISQKLQQELIKGSDLEQISGSNVLQLEAGQIILEENQHINDLYYIKEGRCLVSKVINQKEPIVLGIMETAETFGELSYLSEVKPKSCTTTIQADKNVTLVQLSHGVIDSILRKDVEFARRFFHTISVIIAGRLLKVAYQKTGSYVDEDMPLFITQQNSSASISNEGSSIFIKLHMDTSLILAEIPCKMRGKLGKGNVLISSELLCYYSRPTGLFGHLSKTFIQVKSIVNITSQQTSNSIMIEFIDKNKSQKEVDLQFFTDHQRKRAFLLLSSFTGRNTTKPSSIKSPPVPLKSTSALFDFELSQQDWATLDFCDSTAVFNKDQIIAQKGSFSDGITQIISGSAVIQYKAANCENSINIVISTGEIFGEISFALGLVHSCSLIAHSDTVTVRYINRKLIERIVRLDPMMGAKFYLFLAKILRNRFLLLQQTFLKDPKETLYVESNSNCAYLIEPDPELAKTSRKKSRSRQLVKEKKAPPEGSYTRSDKLRKGSKKSDTEAAPSSTGRSKGKNNFPLQLKVDSASSAFFNVLSPRKTPSKADIHMDY